MEDLKPGANGSDKEGYTVSDSLNHFSVEPIWRSPDINIDLDMFEDIVIKYKGAKYKFDKKKFVEAFAEYLIEVVND